MFAAATHRRQGFSPCDREAKRARRRACLMGGHSRASLRSAGGTSPSRFGACSWAARGSTEAPQPNEFRAEATSADSRWHAVRVPPLSPCRGCERVAEKPPRASRRWEMRRWRSERAFVLRPFPRPSRALQRRPNAKGTAGARRPREQVRLSPAHPGHRRREGTGCQHVPRHAFRAWLAKSSRFLECLAVHLGTLVHAIEAIENTCEQAVAVPPPLDRCVR